MPAPIISMTRFNAWKLLGLWKKSGSIDEESFCSYVSNKGSCGAEDDDEGGGALLEWW